VTGACVLGKPSKPSGCFIPKTAIDQHFATRYDADLGKIPPSGGIFNSKEGHYDYEDRSV
jgi:hypothetical protein